MMKTEEREVLINWMSNNATDEEILQFSEEIKQRFIREQSMISSISKFIGIGSFTKPDQTLKIQNAEIPAVEISEPPGEACSRIGSETRELIRRHLTNGPEGIDKISVIIQRNIKDASSLLKLLWSRNELVWENGKYRLKEVK